MALDNKLRQVTDTIHGAIFLSRLESSMIATPYFFRLHDIYQSSTVYMTYPSNRTKRYEHSLGVMHLASRMLFASVSNADDDSVKPRFFRELNDRFNKVIKKAIKNSNNPNVSGGYYHNLKSEINRLFADRNDIKDIWTSILQARKNAPSDSIFTEAALNKYQYYPTNAEATQEDTKQYFSYRCLLQALRIVALFHDVGHPPFSHILEETLRDLYLNADRSCWNKEREEEFDECLKQFVADGDEAFVCRSVYVNKSLNYADTHERIGFSMLQYAFDDAIKADLGSDQDKHYLRALLIYLIIVAEFAMAIWAESDNFFKSIHAIVDGLIDADRLDYIVRDSRNSGVDWGNIPYERLITPMKLIFVDGKKGDEQLADTSAFVIAFPKKLEEDIIELFLTRYKLFGRVNYHHRCVKTAKALQTSVRMLAENYLRSDEEDINEDVSVLWRALGSQAGNKPLRIIQWNDSFLISMLHRSLVELQNRDRKDRNFRDNTLKDGILLDNLNEILLNKKRYYAVIKRGQDCKAFIDCVFTKIGLTIEKLETFKILEFNRFCSNRKDKPPEFSIEDIAVVKAANECDSVRRAVTLINLLNTGDLELFDALGLSKSIDLMNSSLAQLVKNGEITDYHLIENTGRTKTGIPKHDDVFDEIYLLNSNGKYRLLDETAILKPQIKVIEKSIPWMYVYVVPKVHTQDLTYGAESMYPTVRLVFDKLVDEFSDEIYNKRESLFGSIKVLDTREGVYVPHKNEI